MPSQRLANDPDNYVVWNSGLRPGDEGYDPKQPKNPVQAEIAKLRIENEILRKKLSSQVNIPSVSSSPGDPHSGQEPSKGIFARR